MRKSTPIRNLCYDERDVFYTIIIIEDNLGNIETIPNKYRKYSLPFLQL